MSLNPRKSLKEILRLLSLSPYGNLLFGASQAAGSPAPLVRKTIRSWLSLLDSAISNMVKSGDIQTITVSDINLALQALDAGEQHPFFTAAKGKKGSARRRLSVAIEQYKAVYSKAQLAKELFPDKYRINKFIALQCGGCYSPDRIRKWEKTFDKKLSKKLKRVCEKDIDKQVASSSDKTTALFDELSGALNRLYQASYKSTLKV